MWILKLLLCVSIGFSLSKGDDPLLLTPYINAGNIEEARRLSLVTGLTPNLESYSGFITIEETCDSNLFFWFFPSQNDWLNDPVTLWLQGGPGVSGIKALLQENGPYKLNEDGGLELRENSINQNSSVIYIDNPIGAGFSYSTYECYDEDELVISVKLRSGLDQFMKLFPEISNNPFYVGGEGYGGKFATLVAFDNHIAENKTFNLQGLFIESGAVDMPNQFEILDFLFQIGLADITDYDVGNYFADEIKAMCDSGVYSVASYDYTHTYLENIIGRATYFKDYYNFLYANGQPLPVVRYFLDSDEVRKAIHVGNVPFRDTNDLVAENLQYTIMRPVRGQIEVLLENYRAMFFGGQLSLSFPYSSYRRFIDQIRWSGTEEFRNATRKNWYVDGTIAGYVTYAKNLYEVLVRNAGHRVLADQPKWAQDLFNKFIFNEPIEEISTTK